MAMRHALSKYPDCKFIWYLDQDAYIMDPTRSVEQVVLEPRTLESLMIKDYPVVPPDSIIKTFSHLRGSDAAMIISQDKDGLVTDSLLLRNGDWAKFLTETWLDPLYRTYNFQKAERHAMVSCPASRGSIGRSGDLAKLTLPPLPLGTYCAVAPHGPVEGGAGATADHCVVRPQQPGRRVQGGRLCRHAQGVYAGGRPQL